MKYYFSCLGAIRKKVLDLGLQHFLVSFGTDEKRFVSMYLHLPNTIIDSGSFSVWKSGKIIDIDKYASFCETLPESFIKTNLDVIPDFGYSSEDADRCVEESFDNYNFLSKRINNVLPVFHQFEKFKWLDEWLKLTNYIGISPSKSRKNTETAKHEWLKSVYDKLDVKNTKIKTHGFGCTNLMHLTAFPFFSVDSTTWSWNARARKDGTDWQASAIKEILELVKLEKEITLIWQDKGVTWNV